MEHLSRELARLAWQLQRDSEELRAWANGATESIESDQSVAEVLDRIEHKLTAVHDHTSTLIERVPANLNDLLAELKQTLILRLDEVIQATRSVESNQSIDAVKSGDCEFSRHSALRNQSSLAGVKSLTPQERRVFQLCFQTGFLSYRDIASHLDITPTAAKNLVNRIFQSDRKRPLFTKHFEHGAVRVGLPSELQRQILAGSKSSERKKRTSLTSALD